MTFHVRAFNPNDDSYDVRFAFPETVTPKVETKDEKQDYRRLDDVRHLPPAPRWSVSISWRRTPDTVFFEERMSRPWNRLDDVIVLEDEVAVVGFRNIAPIFSTFYDFPPKGDLAPRSFPVSRTVEMAKISWHGVTSTIYLDKIRYSTISDPDPMIQYSEAVLKGLGLEESSR